MSSALCCNRQNADRVRSANIFAVPSADGNVDKVDDVLIIRIDIWSTEAEDRECHFECFRTTHWA